MMAKLRLILTRPLSAIGGLVALLLMVYELAQIVAGELYQKRLGGIDGTTLVELGILAIYGLFALREKTDLQAASFTLVNGLSFIFAYEALYKWSFYLAPFRLDMPPQELRQLVIQVGTALTVLTGFADGLFTFKRTTFIGMALFVILWILWLGVGFPQITGKIAWPAAMPVDLGYSGV